MKQSLEVNVNNVVTPQATGWLMSQATVIMAEINDRQNSTKMFSVEN